jgi:hypothetical protein
MPVAAIAAVLCACQSTVAATRSKLGINTRTLEPLSPALENKIVRLYITRFGGSPKIARKLNLPLHLVVRTLQARHLIPQPGQNGCRYGVTEKTKTAIRRENRQFLKRLAAKYKVSLIQVKRFLWERH